MDTELSTSLPSIFDFVPATALVPVRQARRRKLGLRAGFLAIAIGTGVAVLLGDRPRRALVGGGIAALALATLRVQLARWFTETPSCQVIGRIGELEIRDYPAMIEARTPHDALDLETALDGGYGRLACYLYGANATREDITRTTPVLTAMRDGAYTVGFVMPSDRWLGTLPLPDDLRIEMREVPARRIAVLRFHGRFTRENIEAHERDLLEQLVHVGLCARGSVVFACYDSPATLPLLRRNELWIEVV
jgi:SOUL heme-binding protein